MLINIRNYIEQLLPPTWRQARMIGVAQVLFQPVQRTINAYNDFKIEATFRAGLTGQKILLESYLQNTIDGEIYIQDENGVNLDFTVVVPQALSADKRKQVSDVVQAYKLASKRFRLSNSIVPPPPPPIALLWTPGFPKAQGMVLLLCVNRSGSYRTRVINNANNSTMLDGTRVYQADVALSLGEWPAGTYRIEVATLSATLTIQQTGDYSLDITPVEKIPGDSNGAWRIVLVEAFRGMRNFNVKWFKGTQEISSYDVNNLNTAEAGFIYFNPKSNEPWKLKENGAGTYMVRVTTNVNGQSYVANNTATFSAAELGIEGNGGGGPIDPPPASGGTTGMVRSHFFRVVKNPDGTFSDTSPRETDDALAYYYVEDVVELNADTTPKPFTNIALTPGDMYTCRKIWVKKSAYPNYNAMMATWYDQDTYNNGPNIYSVSQVLIRT